MKYTKLIFVWSIVGIFSVSATEPPAEVAMEFKVVHESITLCAVRPVSLTKETGEVERYWAALQTIGKQAEPLANPAWLESLNALDQRIFQMAQDYVRHPERAKAIMGWYGGTTADVPRELRDPERKMSDEQWLAHMNPSHKSVVPRTEELQGKHLTQEYLLAWEAWLLAPRTIAKKLQLTVRCFKALTKCATEKSIPTLMAFAESYTATSIAKSYDASDYILQDGTGFSKLFVVLYEIPTAASIDSMLHLVELSSSAGLSITGLSKNKYSFGELADIEWNAKQFIWGLSGYIEWHPETPRLIHDRGRMYLPAIEALLKKEDLAGWKKVLLNQTREAVLQHAPALPK